ncbi:MAG TPA: hypothetical protein VF764_12840 [Steroidobacteraceae bacterium]
MSEFLSWEQLQDRLTRIMLDLPTFSALASRDPCVLAVVRLRDIAEFCGIHRKHLYFIRRGERVTQLYTEPVQRKLTWFFTEWDAGRLEKRRQADGKWRISVRDPQSQGPADAPLPRPAGSPAVTAAVDFLTGRLTVGRRNPS